MCQETAIRQWAAPISSLGMSEYDIDVISNGGGIMPSVTKTLDQQIAATKAKLAKLEAMKAGKGLEKTSPGVEQLLSSLDAVCSANNCNIVDAIQTISRLKKLGLKIERPPRKARGSKSTNPQGDHQ